MRLLDLSVNLLLALSVSALCFGCSSDVTPSEVLGTYIVRYPYGTEELRLARDGIYEQSFLMDGDTTAKTNRGRWELEKKKPGILSYPEVWLYDAMLVDDNFGKPRPLYWKVEPGRSGLVVEKWFGKVSLVLNEDQGFVFRKK